MGSEEEYKIDNSARALHARQANIEMGYERGIPCEVRARNCRNNLVASRPDALDAIDDERE